ncbi:MAG: Sortase family protein [candidate division WS6 bacterium OLB20]|uniref:Sortase family protein n=1 Tax=candidate division WS6 bacterium OLB20 TaxID=1617426 RepID=A0A136LWQ2_9BACT|nr:MAG: Sortase family protein [candidate division WS6 bacterium OLB20]
MTVSIALYVIILPLIPELTYRELAPELQEGLLDQARALAVPVPSEPETGNRLIIPRIGVSGRIWEGTAFATLDNGIWRRPGTSDPEAGGNTVLVAHRYLYGQEQRSFYHLPRLKEGDTIFVLWNETEYEYRVSVTEEVAADAKYIEEPSERNILTLYTCVPLWTSDRRFVVKAEPVSVRPLQTG